MANSSIYRFHLAMPDSPQPSGSPPSRTAAQRAAYSLVLAGLLAGCHAHAQDKTALTQSPTATSTKLELATFGAGCFWCSEAVFERVKGVEKVVSGYSGGTVPNPTYHDVCTGLTGHAEVVQITFDNSVVSYAELLEIFWKTHDPTTLNKQGPDEGPQYRSVVFYHNEEQQKIAEAYKLQLNEAKEFPRPIVTEISPFREFFPAENYHQDFFELNRRNPYCKRYIDKKITKFSNEFKDKLKDGQRKRGDR